MKKEVLFQDDVSAKEYLHKLLLLYPYDIEESMVYSLLSTSSYPHPVLLEFISYVQTILKFHICHKEVSSAPGLLSLLRKMSRLVQKNPSVLHIQQFAFDATILISTYPLAHPYAHLPFHKIPFIDEILLHTIPLLSLPPQTMEYQIHRSKHFIYRDISMDASNFLAISIQIADKHGLIFLAKNCLSLVIALASMYQISEPAVHHDFILIFGLAGNQNKCEYYFDETNELYIGLVSGSSTMAHFLYLKEMITTLYNSICLEKKDLPIHAAMLEITKDRQTYGIVFAGESGTGKSEMLQAMHRACLTKGILSAPFYDDQGTLHYLDNEIVSTASEMGACINLSNHKKSSLFHTFSSSVFLQEEQVVYQITPMITHEQTMAFHKVSYLFYLDNVTREKGCIPIYDLEESIALFANGTYKNALHKICMSPFCNTPGLIQQKEQSSTLLRNFLTLFYVQNIPIYRLCTRGNNLHKEALYDKLAHLILKELLQ